MIHSRQGNTLLVSATAIAAASLAGLLYFTRSGAPAVDAAAPAGESVVDENVSEQLGGYEGILAFLHERAVPALLADPEIASFFTNLTETPEDIEECLARLLDHDLGGDSPKNGARTATGHVCRSSMSNVHKGLNIPDRVITKFIRIVGEEAAAAGVPADVIAQVAKRLERYRGTIRNK
jgi:hypothetical protein